LGIFLFHSPLSTPYLLHQPMLLPSKIFSEFKPFYNFLVQTLANFS
jgi:hypothetical protein